MQWQHGKPEFDLFLHHLTSRVDTMNFTSELSDSENVFLDGKMKIRANKIKTDLYLIPTDSNDYLLYNSTHP